MSEGACDVAFSKVDFAIKRSWRYCSKYLKTVFVCLFVFNIAISVSRKAADWIELNACEVLESPEDVADACSMKGNWMSLLYFHGY